MTGTISDLEVLVLDCQATGAFSAGGRLIEIGWAATRASSSTPGRLYSTRTFLIRPSPGFELPPVVRRITGILPGDLAAGLPAADVWHKLTVAASNLAAASPLETCWAVIHFAPFERPYLEALHARRRDDSPFPLQVICTHKIVQRLFPRLPRRGLRAMAGYWGLSIPGERRCVHHLKATAWIWCQCVKRLAAHHGVNRPQDLLRWLQSAPLVKVAGRVYPMANALRRDLPDRPGVYRMQRSDGQLLYIGKAASLKRRVNSYFGRRVKHADHILEMLSQARGLDVSVSASALEAALLEADDIKRLAPLYNVVMRRGDRALCFCTPEFTDLAASPDDLCRIGPLPSAAIAQGLAAIARAIERNAIDRLAAKELAAIFGTPPASLPEAADLREGFNTFFNSRIKGLAPGKPFYRLLMRVGRDLWLEKHLTAETGKGNTGGEVRPEEEAAQASPLDNSPDTVTISAETVSRRIESTLINGFALIRRSRWLCFLSEATLVWQPKGETEKRRRFLVIHGGAVAARGFLADEAAIPVAPGCQRTVRQRQHNFDVDTYDRLRVLTTEIRRLLAEGRQVTLRPGRRAVLTVESLKKALRWF